MSLALDWLGREGHLLVLWWLWMTLAGLAALPLCFRLLGGLPDKGYTLARALGMLLTTWLFWLLASLGFLQNSAGGIALAWLLFAAGALCIYSRGAGGGMGRFWRENRSVVLVAELLFIALFIACAHYRAHQNGLHGTEKPMELAFISAALRSPTFPPADPWMSGYAISYYYMGYVMSAALSQLSGIGSTLAFNLTAASQLALTGLTAFGVAYNLTRSRAFDNWRRHGSAVSRRAAIAAGGLAAVLLALMGNFQMPLIEMPYNTRAATPDYLDFWGVDKRSRFAEGAYQAEPGAALSLDTSQWEWWWWFRASRVLTDYDLQGNPTATQPIGEFPAFSFLLADNHPHVLALPFVVAVIGLTLNLLLAGRDPSPLETTLYGLALGGLFFLNAWDGAIYLVGFLGADGLRRLLASERGRLTLRDWLGMLRFGVATLAVAAVAYLPYLIGFRSQAGGILPNLAHPTFFPRFFIMFGPFVIILALYLAVECWRGWRAGCMNWRLGLPTSALLLLVLLTLMTALGGLMALLNPTAALSGRLNPAEHGRELLSLLAQRRVEHGLTSALLLLGVAAIVARLFPDPRWRVIRGEVAMSWRRFPRATGFALLLLGLGIGLTLFTDFFYLKDNFGVRINTVFKFYYQAWVVWSIAAAYALHSMITDRALPLPHVSLRLAIGCVSALSIVGGLAYTVAGVHHRAWIETGRYLAENDSATPLTLDGSAGLLPGDDQAAIACLVALVGRAEAVVAEAVQGAYDIRFGRVGALTGIPVVLGWENHERQWRGATYGEIAGSRRADLERLYRSGDFNAAQSIIERYGITHIMYGATERQIYGSAGEDKFLDHLPLVCQSGQSRIFRTGQAAG